LRRLKKILEKKRIERKNRLITRGKTNLDMEYSSGINTPADETRDQKNKFKVIPSNQRYQN